MSSSMPAPFGIKPDTPVNFVKGVGPARAELLANQGLRTALDLIYWFPLRHEDRNHVVTISELAKYDRPVTVYGTVVSARAKRSPVKRLELFEAVIDDGTGTLPLVWFHQSWVGKSISKGDRISVYGLPRISEYRQLKMDNPEYEVLGDGGEASWEGSILPVYSAVGSITPRQMRKIVFSAIDALHQIEDPMPDELRLELGLLPLGQALAGLHFPAELDEPFLRRRSESHRRLIVEEFFGFQLHLRARRALGETVSKNRAIRINDGVRERVRQALPFKLTGAQKRVLKSIADELCSPEPMYRLLQGDVGSGKTIVAVISALLVIENGYQVAMIAPTEILVEQHTQRLRQLVDGSGHTVEKLSAATPTAERDRILRGLTSGEIPFVVGTHALLEDRVEFKELGLAIVDEQHRFGVEQRKRLFAKGSVVDILVMTATPIPRSLALAAYGDLELSVLDELPPGRQPIKTVVRGSARLPKIWSFVEEKLRGGAQAYVVYPLIEESEKLSVSDLTSGVESIKNAFPDRRVEMLHGRMSADEKDAAMKRFEQGSIDILVSTTVIEVGVDVSNASIMVIIDADRFGLAQLHQLRGRVGRGTEKSFCILVRDERATEEAKERLRVLERCADGFAIAEEDLSVRGAGDVLGTRQAGIPKFVVGDLVRDHDLMELAREAAINYVKTHNPARALALAERLAPGGTGVRGRD